MFVTPVALPQMIAAPQDGKPATAVTADFGEMLNTALNNVNDAQVHGNDTLIKYLTGEVQDLHHVIIVSEKAKLTFQLALEVRNKLVEAYQEISRMHV